MLLYAIIIVKKIKKSEWFSYVDEILVDLNFEWKVKDEEIIKFDRVKNIFKEIFSIYLISITSRNNTNKKIDEKVKKR
jgi:hypothetical protein